MAATVAAAGATGTNTFDNDCIAMDFNLRRWACDNLILFPDRMGMDATMEVVTSEAVDWATWATAQGLLA